MSLKLVLIVLLSTFYLSHCKEVIWAVNAGGDVHVDSLGIQYEGDRNDEGTPSDYGKSLSVRRVAPADQILYQTERYHTDNFEYSFPAPKNGDYVLVLKFCEVWFAASGQKVFDVTLNKVTVISDLDIFDKAGRGIAHDEYVPFKVKSGKLTVAGETVSLGSTVTVTFVKGIHDNPKVNALYVMRGTEADVTKLPPLHKELPEESLGGEEEEEDMIDDDEDPVFRQERSAPSQSHKHVSGQKVVDPYSTSQESSTLILLACVLGAFVPLLYCLCKI